MESDLSETIRVIQLVQHVALGGATLVAMALAEGLDPDRFEVTLAAGEGAGPEGNLLEEMRSRGIRVVTVPHLQRNPHPLQDARAVMALRDLLRDETPYIVNVHGSKTRLLLPLAAHFAPACIRVAHIAGWEWQAASSPLADVVLDEAARLGAGSWDAFIACSHATRDQGLARGIGSPEKHHPIWPPVDLDEFRPDRDPDERARVRAELGLRDDDFVIVSALRLARQKAPLDLLRMTRLVADRRPDARLLMIGGGPMEDEVRREIARLGLEGVVIMAGVRRDVPRLMRAANVFALLPAWEPFGMVFAEAGAVGLPTVGARVDGVPEAVADGESGLLVEPGDVAAAADAVLRIGDDAELATRLGEAGIRHAQRFGVERFVAETAQVYERLLAERGA